jgi:hypothetical protein
MNRSKRSNELDGRMKPPLLIESRRRRFKYILSYFRCPKAKLTGLSVGRCLLRRQEAGGSKSFVVSILFL